MRLSPLCAVALSVAAALPTSGCSGRKADEKLLRVGHFPNVTHAQALVAQAMSRRGDGWFEKRLDPGTEIQWFVYNAGPTAMEAILARSLDITYVGPGPAVNAHVRSKGKEIRVVAGSAEGGAALVVAGEGPIKSDADFRGKKIATPQLGNTQDVACRTWLASKGYAITQTGGDVNVLPVENPDQLALMKKGDIDGAWTVEPWVSRLELEAGGRVYVEQKDALTTVLVSSVSLLETRRDVVKKFVAAHDELTRWLKDHADEAQALMQQELKEETTRAMSKEVLAKAWARLSFTSAVARPALEATVADSRKVGFLPADADVSRLLETP